VELVTRVVIVDDDFMVRSIHHAYVTELPGYEVVGMAANGAEAIELIETQTPHLVLLDVHLPDMTGIDVLAELRRRRNYVAVIIVTAERHVEFVRSALRGGASQYLVKPFSAAELHARLKAYARSQGQLEGFAGGRVSDQESIDQVFSRPDARQTALPKGLSGQSLDLVRNALVEHGELSASECADRTGMARVSTRRYLEYLAGTGEAQMRLQYGAGRPVKMFSLVGGVTTR
jgi:response regulator of citrate/malate metabolism